jgi:hypothetical protein
MYARKSLLDGGGSNSVPATTLRPSVETFDKDAPLQARLDFNHQVFAEDIAIAEQQFPGVY